MPRSLRLLLVGILVIGLLGQNVLAAVGLFSADGYRTQHYRSPTPESHEHAQVISALKLSELRIEHPEMVLFDVYRNPWLHGQFTLSEVHANVPGSWWLANCGDGTLTEDWQVYCQEKMALATKNNKQHPIVFYCRSDCWLGWNAVKRAHAWGYKTIYWLRNGIDEWEQQGFNLSPATPVPYP